MCGPAISLTKFHAEVSLAQFLETAAFRKWNVLACAIMFNHFHLVVRVIGDPDPGKILGDFKSWATRKLSKTFGVPESKTWWTSQGSKRKLKTETSITNAIDYVSKKQPHPLVTYTDETPASGIA